MKDLQLVREKLTSCGLKVTPQRVVVLEVLLKHKTHPTAEQIISIITKKHPNISPGTIYKTLETFVEKNLIKKVKTDKGIMRYDTIQEKHHHLYASDSDRIEDYFDDELNTILEKYFKKKKIPRFKIEDIKLQIIGKFIDH